MARELRIKRRQRRLRSLLFPTVGAMLTALALLAYFTDAFKNTELDTVDARFGVRGERTPPKDLVVVKIDADTFNALHMRWPFPRDLHADVINTVMKDKPKAIAYDVQFSEPSEGRKGEDQDFALLEAIDKANHKVVLATTEVNEKGESKFVGFGPEIWKEVRGQPASGLLPPDPGGILRRISHSVDNLETLGVVTAEVATGRRPDPADFGGEDGAWIDYHGPPGTIDAVSFSRVAQGKTRRGFFRDKVVVIGPSAPTLQDIHPTSTGDQEMSGAEIQANAIETAREGAPLRSSSSVLDVALIVVLGLVAPLASMRMPPLRAIALALGLGLAYLVATQLAFNAGTVLSLIYPLGGLLLTSVGALAIHYVTSAFERERMRDMFSRFVPENVVDEVLASADEGLRLGGVQREGTVLFSDLRGFTSFAEELTPPQVIELLNRYLSEMSDAILDHGGTLVAYMGDGIMAVFGAPIAMDDHADRALAASREMLGVRLARFNDYIRQEGLGEGFQMGVGLNSGSVMSGNVGSERRVEYTAIGDTTNTAARLEGMTKGTPYSIFVGEATRDYLKEPADDLFFVDEFEVRGRQAKIRLWSLPDQSPAKEAETGPATESAPPAPAAAPPSQRPTS
jgi:adenylate cyclase